MLNPRILLVLANPPSFDLALDTLLAALSTAARPYGLRFALPSHLAAEVAAAQLPPGALGAGDIKFYDDALSLGGILPLLTDETHFLWLDGAYAFHPQWDRVLLSRYSRIANRRALMTGIISGCDTQAQAYLPAFGNASAPSGYLLVPGVALVCSTAPVKTLIAYPFLLFGPVVYLREADTRLETLSLAAYAAGFAVFALDRAPFWRTDGCPPPALLAPPAPDAMPTAVLHRFEQSAGIQFQAQTVSVRATLGYFNVENRYAQTLPFAIKLRRKAQEALRRGDSGLPLVVTAQVDLPDAPLAPQAYVLRFENLCALHHLPLILYAGGESERRLRAMFPNTLAYPDHSLLPRTLLADGMTPSELFARNKLLLLERTRRSYPSYTHIAWLCADALPHPVCPDAGVDCSALMDDRAHLAWVHGEPDATFLILPRRLLKLFVREVQSITQLDTAMKRDFSEAAMLRRLTVKYPDLFTLHPMPQSGLLFLSCLDRPLISAPLARLLEDLPRPVRLSATPQTREENIPDAD